MSIQETIPQSSGGTVSVHAHLPGGREGAVGTAGPVGLAWSRTLQGSGHCERLPGSLRRYPQQELSSGCWPFEVPLVEVRSQRHALDGLQWRQSSGTGSNPRRDWVGVDDGVSRRDRVARGVDLAASAHDAYVRRRRQGAADGPPRRAPPELTQLCFLDREPAAAQDGAGPTGERGADPGFFRSSPGGRGSAAGLGAVAGGEGVGRTSAAPAKIGQSLLYTGDPRRRSRIPEA
jgi:hypothetical protein